MDFNLNEEQKICQETAKEFAERYIRHRIDEMEDGRTMPRDLYQNMCDAGISGITFEKKYGGLGLGQDCFVLAIEQLAMVLSSAPTPLIISTMLMQAVNMFGTEEQKMHYLPRCISGESIASFAFTEPSTGSDPKQLTCSYREEGDYYVVNGTKRFITNAAYNGPILIFANNEDTGETTGMIFEKFCDGYSISTPWDTLSSRCSPIYDVFMDNVKVPKENVLYKVGGGFTVLKGLIAFSKMALCAEFVGNLGNAYNLALKYAKEKVHRDSTIAKFPTIQNSIARIAGIYYSCQQLVYRLADHASNSKDLAAVVAESAMVKAHVSDNVAEGARLCMTVLGAYGVCEEYSVARCLRDAIQAPHVEGVSDMQRIIFGSYTLSLK